MRAGRLDRPVLLQEESRSTTRDPNTGTRTPTWSPFAKTQAGRRQLSGSESYRAGADQAVVEAEYEIRHMPGVTPKLRLMDRADGDRLYDILAVDSPGRQERMVLKVRARAE